MSCLNDANQTLMGLLGSWSEKVRKSEQKARFKKATLIIVNMRRMFGAARKEEIFL